MKKNLFLVSIVVVFLVSILATPGCRKDDDNKPATIDSLRYQINNFIYANMYYCYLWNGQVSDLSDTRFKSQTEFDNYVLKTNDHQAIFEGLLYKYGTVDKWSWIVDDYVALDNMFQGITKSMGFEFMLVRYGTNNVLGIVEYVIKGGPADRAGVKRGDIFIKINYTPITTSNYADLLYNQSAYTLSFAYITGNTIYPHPDSENKSMVAEVVSENPILMDSVYTVNSKKVGYLVYNGFMINYHKELNTVFGKFKDEGVEELIVDLRYNGGGALYTSICLGSMIYGKEIEQVFVKTQYNSYLQNIYQNKYGSGYFIGNFTDSIVTNIQTSETEPINTLSLNQVYFITTDQTASASELLINGLKPYMTVKTVGDSTHGKYVGSFTIYDIYKGDTAKNHHWALQPITFKYSNSQNVTDFTKGLYPSILTDEDIANLQPFGDINEPMFKAALDDIRGVSSSTALKSARLPWKKFADSKDRNPHLKEVYMDKIYQRLR